MARRSISKTEATPDQRAAYLESGLEVLAAIDEAIRLLRFEQPGPCDEDGRERLRGHLLGLTTARAHVLADLIGYLSDSFRLRVPDPRLAEELRDASRTLFRMLPGRESVDDVLSSAEVVLAKWADTRA